MVVAFSFCHSDKQQAIRLAQWIRRLGGVERHSCLIVHPESTDASGIEEPLRQVFGYVEVMRYDAQLSGWPAGPNEQHAKTAQFLCIHKRMTGPWLFMEADCLPTSSHWMDRMEMEHRMSGMPMLGALNNTIETSTGRVVGKHTTGVAVYPQDFARICPLVRNMINTSAEYVRAGFLPPAFDVYYEAYTVAMTFVSPLIQHFWKSHSFIEKNGQITCEFQRPYEGAPSFVSPEAVLVHGCKDGSLLDLLEARMVSTAPARSTFNAGVEQSVARHAHNVKAAGSSPAPAILPSAGGHGAQGDPATGSVSPFETPPAEAPRPLTEAELDADPNAPVMPPFPKGSPEDVRRGELARMKWPEFQKYAAHKLKLKAFGVPRADLVNHAVLKEREQGKEPWTKALAQMAPLPPPKPIEPVRQWNTGDGTAVPMSEIQYQRMVALRSQREAVGA